MSTLARVFMGLNTDFHATFVGIFVYTLVRIAVRTFVGELVGQIRFRLLCVSLRGVF